MLESPYTSTVEKNIQCTDKGSVSGGSSKDKGPSQAHHWRVISVVSIDDIHNV